MAQQQNESFMEYNQTSLNTTENKITRMTLITELAKTSPLSWAMFKPDMAAYIRVFVFGFLGISANMATIIALTKTRAEVSHHLRLVGNLAVADMCFAACYTGLPLTIVFDKKEFHETFSYVGLIFCAVTVMTIIGLSLDVYMSITIPLRYRDILTRPRVIVFIVFTWLLPLFMILPLVVFQLIQKTDLMELGLTLNRGIILTCLFILVLAYLTASCLTLKRRVKSRRNSGFWDRKRRTLVTTFLVIISFMICWSPWLMHGFVPFPDWMVRIKIMLLAIHAIIDPLIYGLRMKEIRDTYIQWAKAVGCYCKCANSRM